LTDIPKDIIDGSSESREPSKGPKLTLLGWLRKENEYQKNPDPELMGDITPELADGIMGTWQFEGIWGRLDELEKDIRNLSTTIDKMIALLGASKITVEGSMLKEWLKSDI